MLDTEEKLLTPLALLMMGCDSFPICLKRVELYSIKSVGGW